MNKMTCPYTVESAYIATTERSIGIEESVMDTVLRCFESDGLYTVVEESHLHAFVGPLLQGLFKAGAQRCLDTSTRCSFCTLPLISAHARREKSPIDTKSDSFPSSASEDGSSGQTQIQKHTNPSSCVPGDRRDMLSMCMSENVLKTLVRVAFAQIMREHPTEHFRQWYQILMAMDGSKSNPLPKVDVHTLRNGAHAIKGSSGQTRSACKCHSSSSKLQPPATIGSIPGRGSLPLNSTRKAPSAKYTVDHPVGYKRLGPAFAKNNGTLGFRQLLNEPVKLTSATQRSRPSSPKLPPHCLTYVDGKTHTIDPSSLQQYLKSLPSLPFGVYPSENIHASKHAHSSPHNALRLSSGVSPSLTAHVQGNSRSCDARGAADAGKGAIYVAKDGGHANGCGGIVNHGNSAQIAGGGSAGMREDLTLAINGSHALRIVSNSNSAVGKLAQCVAADQCAMGYVDGKCCIRFSRPKDSFGMSMPGRDAHGLAALPSVQTRPIETLQSLEQQHRQNEVQAAQLHRVLAIHEFHERRLCGRISDLEAQRVRVSALYDKLLMKEKKRQRRVQTLRKQIEIYKRTGAQANHSPKPSPGTSSKMRGR